MANYSSTAKVTLSVNGKQAEQMLSKLQDDARRLQNRIEEAAKAGDKVTMKKFQRELNSTNRLMNQLRGSSVSTEEVMKRLDRASPKELNKVLRQLKAELNNIERGSAAWDAQIAKIKQVRSEIAELNDEMKPDESLWDKIRGFWDEFQVGILGVTASLAGLVAAGKAAVNAYAGMQQEMANVQKYTGMTAEEVEGLNEELKKMDTRTSREDLNKLAQEAGRLGKTSKEDVLGFVRAADQINVALDDLGEGATLTLSKLTGIFGDEERLGTEKALLSVGSVINELSQNCSASAPYLAEFASRLGGVGSQAGMTVQQIMGYAAVLDSNNQALEASATALSQVMVRIYQDPAKYARVSGLDVQHFTALVKEDMNAALIELLKTLQQAGSMDVLSPMFKDMGENGSRAISALSTLAGHIDEVVAQQEVANTAFKEATSIGKEYDVQNNTVQASLDKAKARVHELAVELGEKLQPVMRFCISSSTVFLKVLSSLVDFVIANQRAIIAVTVALTAYNVVMLVHNARMTAATRLTVLYNGALNLLKRLLPAVRLLFTPLINAVQYFTNGLQVNYTMQERWRKSMAAMNFSSWTGLILTLGSAIYMLVDKWRSAKEEAERVRKEQEEYKRSLTDLDSTASQYCASELARLDSLYKAATNNAKSTDERKKAAERMQSLYPAYFKNLSTEQIMVGQASRTYKELRDSIIQAARARAAASKIEENEKQLLDLEAEQEKLKKKMDDDARKVNATRGSYNRAERRNSTVAMLNNQNFVANEDVGTALNTFHKAVSDYERSSREYWNNVNTQRQIHNANQYLSDKYSKAAGFKNQQDPGIPTIPAGGGGAVSGGGGGGGRGKGGSGGGGSSASQDRFAKEREWREREEASARISWRTGETDYLAYTKRMDEIAVEFYEKQLEHTDLSETEKLKIIADWRDAQYKQQETLDNQTVEREEKHYNLRLSTLKQYYIDGTISKETYEEKVEEAEIEHQKRLVDIYKAGSKEQLQASQRLKDLLLQQMEKRQQETQKLQEQMAAMQKEYFGEDPNEQSKKMFVELIQLKKIYDNLLAQAGDNEKRRLDIVEAYEKAVLLIRKKYGMEGGKASANGLINALEKANEWMKSEAAQKFAGAMSTVVSGMSAIFSQLNTGIQADLQIQTAEINKRYDAELSRAEGNTYKVRKLEKDKEKELAKAKNEANRKMFAMQVIQAVSQTYQNALSAYGAALKVGGMAGIILAPSAAAMAMAAGMMQVANIKKQQQASEAQGYAEGGFTPKGRRDEAVGVVHAGEWVASQKLVNNPRTRPLLEALDYAQRTNTIGSITAADVSRSITAPMLLASQPAAQPVVVQPAMPTVVVEQNGEYAATMRRLADRLNQPFVTINTVTGEYGSLKADEDYARLMKNKSPKSRKS